MSRWVEPVAALSARRGLTGLAAAARTMVEDRDTGRRGSVEASRGWTVRAAADSSAADVQILYPIGGWFGVDPSELVSQIRGLDVDEINVLIDSPGGDVFGATAIYNALVQHRASVTVTVMGLAASAASFIAQAGDRRVMSAGSMMMIHRPWGVAVGNADDMTATADLLVKAGENLAGLYAARSGMSDSDAQAAMTAETWYTAAEAVEAGLADEALPAKTGTGETSGGDEPGDTAAAMRAEIDKESLFAALKEAFTR